MREHNALGSGAGAAGVENLGDGVFVNFHDVGAVGSGGGKQFVVIFWREPIGLRRGVEKIESFDRRGALAEGIHNREKILFEKEHFRSGVVQNKCKLMGCKPDIEGEQDCTSVENAIVGFEQAMAVHAEEGDAVAGLHARRAQRTRKQSGTMSKLSISETQISANDCSPARELFFR